jgi:hypothetical protein
MASKDEQFVRQYWVIAEFEPEMSPGGYWHFKEGHPLNAVGWRRRPPVRLRVSAK